MNDDPFLNTSRRYTHFDDVLKITKVTKKKFVIHSLIRESIKGCQKVKTLVMSLVNFFFCITLQSVNNDTSIMWLFNNIKKKDK